MPWCCTTSSREGHGAEDVGGFGHRRGDRRAARRPEAALAPLQRQGPARGGFDINNVTL